MRVLADTHAFLWFVFEDPRLSAKAGKVLSAGGEIALSTASLWEIAIKTSIGKLELGWGFDEFVEEFILKMEVTLLPIGVGHLTRYASLPLLHRDPFDRLLIAQALEEDIPLVTEDARIRSYEVRVIW